MLKSIAQEYKFDIIRIYSSWVYHNREPDRFTFDELEEVLRILRKFVPKRNPRIERAVAASYAALKNIRQHRADASPMQSLAYGWFVPLWVALGLSKEDADSELDGGKCDASSFDPRVATMLGQEPFGSGQTEGGQ